MPQVPVTQMACAKSSLHDPGQGAQDQSRAGLILSIMRRTHPKGQAMEKQLPDSRAPEKERRQWECPSAGVGSTTRPTQTEHNIHRKQSRSPTRGGRADKESRSSNRKPGRIPHGVGRGFALSGRQAPTRPPQGAHSQEQCIQSTWEGDRERQRERGARTGHRGQAVSSRPGTTRLQGQHHSPSAHQPGCVCSYDPKSCRQTHPLSKQVFRADNVTLI